MSTPESNTDLSPAEPPVAQVVSSRRLSWAWIVPLLAVLAGGYLIYSTYRQTGPSITITFAQGYGLKEGDALRHRGIVVGEVREVKLSENLQTIDVSVRLDPAAAAIACEGSRFWIVRPEVSLQGVDGLDTLVGAQYIAVLPGHAETPQFHFQGLPAPLPEATLTTGGLEILLMADQRGSLRPGAPVTYRQMQIGRIRSVDLASDATFVAVQAYIEPQYAPLVRENTRFWNTSGFGLNFGIEGFRLETESLQSLVAGGVTLATPDDPGQLVSSEHRFTLHAKPEKEWLEWKPRIALETTGPTSDPSSNADLMTTPPRPLATTLRWQTGRFIIRSRSHTGQLLPVPGGLLGPADLIIPASTPRDGTTRIEIDRQSPTTPPDPLWSDRGLAMIPFDDSAAPTWPLDRIRRPEQPENVSLLLARAGQLIPIDAAHLQPMEQGWLISNQANLPDHYHGAPVLARSDRHLLGILLLNDPQPRIIFLPQDRLDEN